MNKIHPEIRDQSQANSPEVDSGVVRVEAAGLEQAQTLFPKETKLEISLHPSGLLAGTEVLTEKGWKVIETLQPGEKVAQYEEDGSLRFVLPTDSSQSTAPYHWQFSNHQGHVDLAVSPNHRMVMRTLATGEPRLKVETADNCRHNPYSAHIMAGKLANKDAKALTPVERLLIAFQADGSVQNTEVRDGSKAGYIRVNFKLMRARKIDRLRHICRACGFGWDEWRPSGDDGELIISVKVPPELRFKKRFESWLDLSVIDSIWASEFIEEVSRWDGHRVNGGDKRITWTNSNLGDIDAVQTVAVLAGYRTHFKTITDTRYYPMVRYYRLQICRHRDYFRGNQIQKRKVDGEVKVYGLQVPSGMLLVRRNGFVAVTGNSNHIELFRRRLM